MKKRRYVFWFFISLPLLALLGFGSMLLWVYFVPYNPGNPMNNLNGFFHTDGELFAYGHKNDEGHYVIDVLDREGNILHTIVDDYFHFYSGTFGKKGFYYTQLDPDKAYSYLIRCDDPFQKGCEVIHEQAGVMLSPLELDNGDIFYQRSANTPNSRVSNYSKFNFYLLKPDRSSVRLETRYFHSYRPPFLIGGTLFLTADFLGSEDYFGNRRVIDDEGVKSRNDYIATIDGDAIKLSRRDDKLKGSYKILGKYYVGDKVVYYTGTTKLTGYYIYQVCVVDFSPEQTCHYTRTPTTNPAFADGQVFYGVWNENTNRLSIKSKNLGG